MYFDPINISLKTPHRSYLTFLINIMFFLSKQTSYEIQFVLADCYSHGVCSGVWLVNSVSLH